MSSTHSCNEHIQCPVHHEPVILNVYDMCGLNGYTSPLGIGIFHTGVEVYGVEYGFDACESPAISGIYRMHPRNASELGEQFHYRKSICMGHTNYTSREVEAIVAQLGLRFRGDSYHLTNNNCNHFSNALTRALVGHGIPGWVNRLAHIVAHLPLLRHCLPQNTASNHNCCCNKRNNKTHTEKRK